MNHLTNRAISPTIVEQCRRRLQQLKQDLLNRVRISRNEFSQLEKSAGDEGDRTLAQLAEDQLLLTQERLRRQLFEIEAALSRIAEGTFGICEETQEPIEEDRLFALPYTRLSIEGAEIRESLRTRQAR